MKPIWLLDVDGVLNAVHPRRDEPWGNWKSGQAGETFRYHIWFSPTVTGTIRKLHEADLVEVQWLTTWGSDANLSLRRLFRLPAFTVAAEPPRDRTWARDDSWWKLDVAQDVVAANPGRPIIWTDDELNDSEDAWTWARALDALLISPDTNMGLEPTHLNQITRFCQRPELAQPSP